MDFYENDLLKFNDGKIVRILYLNDIAGLLYVIDMGVNKMPYVIKKEWLLSLQKSLEVNLIEDNFFNAVCEAEITDAEREKRDTNWEIVSFLLIRAENREELFISKYRTKIIKEACSTFKVSFNTIKNILIMYWKGGSTKNALIPGFRRCGAKGVEKKAGLIKRGRPTTSSFTYGVNVDDRIKKFFKIGINRYYYNERKNSLKITYELIIKDFFTEEVEQNGISAPILRDTSKIPTFGQFYYWYKKKFGNVRNEVSKRHGERVYQQNFRTIIGDSTQDAGLGPASLYQIDSTVFDIYLVSSLNRDLIVGRPILFLAIDVYSRSITGVHISFESLNSYIGAMLALANSMTKKKEFCAKYGVLIEEADWDCSYIPSRILSDRGELDSAKIENAIMNLGITIQQTPPYRCDYKGVIEQAFRQMNLRVKPFVDGVVANENNIIARGDSDYRLKCNLTLAEFTEIIIRCILFYNNYHVLSDYITDEMMLKDGVEKIPAKIWKHGLDNRKGMLRNLPKEVVELSLFPSDYATITPRGVNYHKMLYASEYALKMNWFGLARAKGSWKIQIAYNPQDMSEIYAIDADGRTHHKLFLLENMKKFMNKSYTEIEQIISFEKDIEGKGKGRELQEKVKLFNDIEGIVKNARISTESERDITKSKSKRLKGIKENNKEEREYQREIRKSEIQDIQVVESEHLDNFNNDLEMIREIQRGGYAIQDE